MCVCVPLSLPSPSLRQYISSEGLSLQKARRFLERESGRLSERQAALQAAQAQSSSSQYPNTTSHAQATQEMYRNLQQVRVSVPPFLIPYRLLHPALCWNIHEVREYA